MKKTYLFLFLVLVQVTSYSQDIFPLHNVKWVGAYSTCMGIDYEQAAYRSYFGNEFTHWYAYHSGYDVSFSNMYSVEGDTVLSNGISYKKLCDSYADGTSVYYSGMREDAKTGSLFINTGGDTEVLVSRMDLELGDKFYFSPAINNFNDSISWMHYCFRGVRTDENGNYTVVDSIYSEDK